MYLYVAAVLCMVQVANYLTYKMIYLSVTVTILQLFYSFGHNYNN